MKTKLFFILSLGLIILLNSNSANAATFNWIGLFGNNFNQANNWHENAVPGINDIVQIAVAYTPVTNMAVLSTAGTTTIGSLIYGGNFSILSGNMGITVNSGSTLNITGDITFKADNYASVLNAYNIVGGGTIKAVNMNINANYGVLSGLAPWQQVNCSINSLVLSGNLALTSEEYLFTLIPYSETAYFNLTAGTTEIDGDISTSNTIATAGITYPASQVIINPVNSTGATLQLNGVAALSGLSAAGSNIITFGHTYATVNYAGSAQTVYTNSSPNTSAGTGYYNLTISGSGIETAGSGTLNVSNNLSLTPTTAMTFDLNANATVSAIGNFSSATPATLKQGSGQNFVVSGTAVNAGIINLVGNSSMLFNGTAGLLNSGTINGLSGYASLQNISTTAGPLTNSGVINWYGIGGSTISANTLVNSGNINMLSLGTIISSGQVTNSGLINKTNGIFTAAAGFTNSATGIFRGTTATGTTGKTNFTGNFINNDSLRCNAEPIYFGANYTNNAFFKAGTGMVYFSGSTQTLLDNSTAGTLFNNVTFQQSGIATITSGTGNFAVSAPSSLYMVSPASLVAGTTTIGGAGYLTIMSNAAATATVYTPTGTSITGNINVQRYITSGTGTRGYRLLASPVNVSLKTNGTGNTGLSYLNANAAFGGVNYYGAFTSGPGTGFTANGLANPIIYLYDESRPTNNTTFVSGKNIGVYSITGAPAYSLTSLCGAPAVTTPGLTVPVGNSYIMYYIGSNRSTVVSSSRVPDSTTLTATGYLNQGSVPVKYWKTGSTSMPYDVTTGTVVYGLSQIGNPYASTIDLNALYTDNYVAGSNAISPVFYELIPGGNYVSYNAFNSHLSDARATRDIVSGQGFMSQTTATGQTITFKEDQKVAYNATAALLESIPVNPSLTINSVPSKAIPEHHDAQIAPVTTHMGTNTGLHLQLTKDSADYAQTGIYFSRTGSDKYAPLEDGVQVNGGTPVVYLSSYSSDSVKLSINSMADYGPGKNIRLFVNAVSTGAYAISLADISGFDTAGYHVYLVDLLKHDSTDLVRTKTYAFDLNTADTTTFGSGRFVLVIVHKPLPLYVLAAFTGQKVPTGVQLNWTAKNAGNYTGYTLQKLCSNGGYDSLYCVQSDSGITAYHFIDKHPIIGDNVYRLVQNGINGVMTYSPDITVGYSSTTPVGALTLYPNPASTIMNVSLTSSAINMPGYVSNIYNSSGVRVSQQTISRAAWTNDVTNYKLGVYVMQVKDLNGNVVGTSKFIKVR